ELRREDIDLTAIAEEVCSTLLRDTGGACRLDLVIQEGLRAHGDARLVKIALENLLRNAWKFTSKRAEARIEVGRLGDTGPFFVRDNGAGFDNAQAGKLFGAFQRLHSAHEFEGHGIG